MGGATVTTVLASAGETVFSGSLLLALPVAVLAGLVSFASPCVLPLLPGYLGFLGGMAGQTAAASAAKAAPGAAKAAPAAGGGAGRPGAAPGATVVAAPRRRRLLLGVVLFVAGFTAVFVAYGALFGTLGLALAQHQATITRWLGVVVVLMGLAFLGAFAPLQRTVRMPVAPTAGLGGAPLLGIAFGLGWTPCMGPTLVAISALSLEQGTAARGAVLAVAYCLGLGLPFVGIALGLDSSTKMVDLMRAHRVGISRAGGVMLVLIGLALVTGLWASWTQSLAGLVAGFETLL